MGPSIFTVTLNPGLDRTLTVPAITYNEVLRAAESRVDVGGKGFNVSRALKALGMDSIAMGFVGGAVGTLLEDGLRELGIATDFVRIAGDTRTNTVVTEMGSSRYLKVNEAGPTISSDELAALMTIIRERATVGSNWVVSGSLPPGVPANVYARIIAEVQAVSGRVYLDASGDALRKGCAERPYLVKPNAEEAKEISGIDIASVADAAGAVRVLLAAGAQRVALSMGENGLLFAAGAELIHAKPPSVDVRTVVGVGDALLAGLVYAAGHGFDAAETARWGVACGTAAAMGEGVSVGDVQDVKTLFARVRAYPLE